MPQDKRVAGKASLNASGKLRRAARRSLPRLGFGARAGGEFAELARRPPRTTDTKDLSASLRSSGRSLGVGSVLDLGAGGMLVELSSDLEVGEIVGFELVGPRFRSVGLAAVAHREEKAIGLRFDTWEGSVDRSICALVAERLRRGQLGSADPGEATIGLPGPDSGGHAGLVRAAEKS